MRNQVLQAIEHSPADYTEIRLERAWHTKVSYRGNDLENIEASLEHGGIVRSLVGGGWGVSVFNSTDQLERRVQDAFDIARLISDEAQEPVELAPVEPVQDEVRVSLEKDPRSVPLEQKQTLLQGYNEIMLGHSVQVISTQATYTDSFKEVTFANSEGSYIVQELPDVTLRLIAVAREGDTNIQTAFESFGKAAGFEVVEGREGLAEAAAQRAVRLLQAKPATGGVYTVILDQHLTGVFIHEAFGHLCEADFLFKDPQLQERLRPGRRFGVEQLNVIEDGYRPGARGNFKYDDEGVPRQRVYLIKAGVLQGFMHSRQTAARMRAEPTGNARAGSYRFEPVVRMRNTYVEGGSAAWDQMIQGIDYGIYACQAFGGNTALEQFTFSAGYGYEIVDGQVGGLLRDVVLTGNIFETLKHIDMVGSDLKIIGLAGGCIKHEKTPLPITLGGPHIRIQNLTVGGRAA